MASSYPPPFEDQGEVREGFLCPLCLKDLQSFTQLQAHYEDEHSSEDKDVKGQLKNLVQKAKKAKDKLLGREGEDRPESGAQDHYESFYNGGVDPYMWEPQEIGATKSHLDDFKKHRASRIDHYVIEVNKLIIRLEKLTSFDRVNTDSAKVRAIEKSVVPWVSDQDVPFCPDCGNKFSIRNRRHHCRLCGSIMCKKCTELVPLPLAHKLTSASKEAISSFTSPNQSPGNSVQSSRRGSVNSVSSVSSVLEEKDDDRIRCCGHCKDVLLKRELQIEEKDYTPDIVKLYGKLRLCMEKVDQKAPDYIKMAESLNAGETTYNLDRAQDVRVEVQKLYEFIDALSKKILTLGMNEDPKPHPKTQQLQRMIRYSATLFVQEKLLGLMSLPTREAYEQLKEKKKQEREQKLQRERQAALEAQKRRLEEKQRNLPARSTAAPNGEALQPSRVRVSKSGGWLPSSSLSHTRENADPLLQQIENIRSFIQQAREANRTDEVRMLEENLRQLQDEYDEQQTLKAIELSRREAEKESMQQEQLQILQQREWERDLEQRKKMAQHLRTRSLDFREANYCQRGVAAKQEQNQTAKGLDLQAVQPRLSLASKTQSLTAFGHPASQGGPAATLAQGKEVSEQNAKVEPNKLASLNPFEEDLASSPVQEGDSSNPFTEEASSKASAPSKNLHNGKKEYNPFEDDEEVEEAQKKKDTGGSSTNPFEDHGNPFDDHENECRQNSGNLTKSLLSTNPFDDDDDDAAAANNLEDEAIDEELLLQQIDNIRAYIFDAKLSGRLDEVEVLKENLGVLQHTLAEQKQKAK
ncbi:rabenosyn-5 [Latimeria chalumnae]|uniref:rabenosyn-5 n=1 Tax=Latimeria chalumnae TaxID=7897 RepID=UPI0006D8EE88|nr:PREDICTED: rabenosyn-5 [Latimeria chalumnae]|eukprot:XP_014345032.1 PREDICTED: rabenosyn-5 [Latimeria chalumnae]